MTNQDNFVANFIIGGTSASIAKTLAAPIERVKLLIQSQDEMIKEGTLSKRYRGAIDAFRRTVAYEGAASLWRGNLAGVLQYFPTQALNFAFRDKYKAVLDPKKSDSYWWWFAGNLAAGSAAGGTTLTFVYSIEYARTRLALDAKRSKGGERKFTGIIDVYRKTLATSGIAGLYRGFVPSLAGIVVFRGLYFGLYDSIKPLALTGSYQQSFTASFLLGWMVSTVAGLAAYPFDTLRRRMMVRTAHSVKYKSTFDAFTKILVSEGVAALYRGAGTNVVRSMAMASELAIYDQLQYLYFGERRPHRRLSA